MRFALGCVLTLWLALLVETAWAQRVAFINPGKKTEAYWLAAAQSMEGAARSLGQTLEVFYAEREHLRVFEFARELVARPPAQRPDYVVFSNDYGTGAELLRIFEGSGIRCFLAFSKPPADGPQGAGQPRERFKHWIGALEPRAEDAGYLTARALIEQGRAAKAHGPDGKLHLLAIAGDRSTTASVLRNEGMRRAVKEAGDVVIAQEVYADWSRDKAAEQATWLWQRHPQARLVWAGNDLMAFGAMAAWEKRGGAPGKTAWFSGINTSTEAMAALKAGRLAALAGGHFITGAWALVMIHDHHRGRDFADEGLALERPMFTLFNARSADTFLARFGERAEPVDYRRYSKVLNPQVRRYEFGFEQLLR
ncbi:MAG: ABC transporter substrate-binding protein [Hydrogenophaga sp.]|nr:ABC transporter substrate-binding protein [Hydrogenophaga sp.]